MATASGRITVLAWRDLWTPGTGGAEIYLTRMLRALVRSGYEVTVLTAGYPGSKRDEMRDGIRYLRRGGRYSIYLLLPIFYVLSLKRKTDFLIESYNWLPFWTPFFERRHMVIIYHIQWVEWLRMYGTIIGGAARWFIGLMFPAIYRTSPIVTISDSTEGEIRKMHFKPKAMSVISTGIDLPIRSSIDKPTGKVSVLSLGRLQKTKNVDRAIGLIDEAVKDRGINDVHLWIAGRGDEEEKLKEIVEERNLGLYVEFLGYVSDEKKIELYRDAHLHIQLSDKEGWGITAIEAASQATPTVCMDVPGLRDSVKKETGYIAKDMEELRKIWPSIIAEVRNSTDSYLLKQKECLKWSEKFRWGDLEDRFVRFVSDQIKV